LIYRNETIVPVKYNSDGTLSSFCCGITFEVFFRLLDFYPPLSVDDVKKIQLYWYCDCKTEHDNEKGALKAIVLHNLGERIENLDQAMAGDFIQFWRSGGSGHSVVFLEWIRCGSVIIGFRYWSSQSSTNGIGYNTEYFATGTTPGVLKHKMYIARLLQPK
jgi:hypothetical protein